MIFVKLLLVVVMSAFLAVFFTKIAGGKTTTWEIAARQVREAVAGVVKGFFTTPPVRHMFDEILSFDLHKIVADYKNPNFETLLRQCIIEGAPCIGIRFVANSGLGDDDISYVAEVLRKKFREYLSIYHLNWPNFIYFAKNGSELTFYIFYCEFPADCSPFEKIYRRMVASPPTNTAILRDDALERELGGFKDDES